MADGERIVTNRGAEIRRVLWLGFALNLVVAVAKFAWGVLTRSSAMANDGVASFLDALSTVIGIIGVSVASRPPTARHPYGHAKYETYASAAIGALLLVAAAEIAREAIVALLGHSEAIQVDATSYAVMVVTLVINLFVARWEGSWGRRLRSEALVADAKHTYSDVYVSLSVICSLVFVQLGYPEADAIVSLIVALAVLASALSIFWQAHLTLADVSRLDTEAVHSALADLSGLRSVGEVRSRGSEGAVYVDLRLSLDPTLSLVDAHQVAREAERRLEEAFPEVQDVVVYMEPDEAGDREPQR